MPLNVIAIEEHFWKPELRGLRPTGLIRGPEDEEGADGIRAFRIGEVDEGGIDMEGLSETAPAGDEAGPGQAIPAARRLDDIGAFRIGEMDEAGIDMQVLSETAPAVHELDPDKAIPLARRSNEYLHEQISRNPTRFTGFAALPVADPKAAAEELERAVM